MSTWDAWAICPNMLAVVENPAKYRYWCGKVFSLLKEFSPDTQILSVDEAVADISHIVKNDDPLPIAQLLKERFAESIGEWPTCTIGIAKSKVLAKIAGETHKPNGITWFSDERLPEILKTLNVEAASGIGKQWTRRLNGMGIWKMGDVTDYDLYRLKKRFGLHGLYVGMLCQGADSEELIPNKHTQPRKGYGNGRVISMPHPDFTGAKKWLKLVCYETAFRMKKDNICGHVVSFSGSSPNGYGVSKQYALPFPTNDPKKIYETCLKIADMLIDRMPYEFNGIGVHVTKLVSSKGQTIPLFAEDRKELVISETMQRITEKFGALSVYDGFMHDVKMDLNDGKLSKLFKANQAMHRDAFDES